MPYLVRAHLTRLLIGLLDGSVITGAAMVPELVGNERVVQSISYFSGNRGCHYYFNVLLSHVRSPYNGFSWLL